MSHYAGIITSCLRRLGRSDVDARHVEGYVRLEYGTLGHLSADTFLRETRIAVACIDAAGVEQAERLAVSFGLRPEGARP